MNWKVLIYYTNLSLRIGSWHTKQFSNYLYEIDSVPASEGMSGDLAET